MATPVAELTPLFTGVFRGPSGAPIANGLLFLSLTGTNNRATAYLTNNFNAPFREWPYQLSQTGKASLWVPIGQKFDINVFGPAGRLLLYSTTNVEGQYGSNDATGTSSTTTSASNKTFTYVDGVLTQLDEFTDSTLAELKRRKEFLYTGGKLTHIVFKDAQLNTTSVRVLGYTGDQLTSITEF